MNERHSSFNYCRCFLMMEKLSWHHMGGICKAVLLSKYRSLKRDSPKTRRKWKRMLLMASGFWLKNALVALSGSTRTAMKTGPDTPLVITALRSRYPWIPFQGKRCLSVTILELTKLPASDRSNPDRPKAGLLTNERTGSASDKLIAWYSANCRRSSLSRRQYRSL